MQDPGKRLPPEERRGLSELPTLYRLDGGQGALLQREPQLSGVQGELGVVEAEGLAAGFLGVRVGTAGGAEWREPSAPGPVKRNT